MARRDSSDSCGDDGSGNRRNDQPEHQQAFDFHDVLDMGIAVAQHLKPIFLFSILAGLIMFVVASQIVPAKYVSESYLEPAVIGTALLERVVAPQTLMRTPPVLDAVLGKFPEATTSTNQARRMLNARISFADAIGPRRDGGKVVILRVQSGDAQHARELNAALVAAWLDAVRLAPAVRARLERRLALGQENMTSLSQVMRQVERSLVVSAASDGAQTEVFATLLTQRSEEFAEIENIKAMLAQGGREAVVAEPSVPTSNGATRQIILATLFAMFAAAMFGVGYICTGVGLSKCEDATRDKMTAIGAALLPWKAVRHPHQGMTRVA